MPMAGKLAGMTAPVRGSQARIDELAELAAEAFIYGFPLVFDLQEVERFTRVGMGALAAAPLNVFSHATSLAGPKDTFVSINNDTIYSIANLDVSGGPVRLEVPEADGRYYVLQFVDAWTNNFAYIGRRATGTGRVVLAGRARLGWRRAGRRDSDPLPDQGGEHRRALGSRGRG